MRIRLLLAVALLLGVVVPSQVHALPPDAKHREEWITTDDPLVEMHADVVRHHSTSWAKRQPVILVATPYGNHAGSTSWWPNPAEPNDRFDDFLELSDALAEGYTYVIVDLPGYGGSSGCGDLGGPLERAAVSRAVEWAADQPWSSGRVALFGKSYDGWTALMGVADRPRGLVAAVAMEPVYSPYTVDFAHGVRNARSFLLPGLYAEIDSYPGTPGDSPRYHANSVVRPQCYAWSQAHWMNDDEHAPFWQERNLPADSVGSPVPVFLTQGLLEANTVPRGAFDYFNSLGHPGNRALYGQFGHIRGWEAEAGRPTFVDEVMRFLDQHLRDIEPTIDDRAIAVQDSFGRYRAEDAWPPADALPFTTELRTGRYLDVAVAAEAGRAELWTSSQALPHDVWLAGEARVRLTVSTASFRTNVYASLWDVDEWGYATEVTRDAYLVRQPGTSTVEIDMMGQDWVFEAGHRLAVRISPPSSSWFVPVPTGGLVEVVDAEITLPLLTQSRTSFEGRLVNGDLDWARDHWFRVPTEGTEVTFSLPAAIDTGTR